jgi:nicotinate-nucleotide pyrophosphorylase (carboxylating)
MYYFKRIDKSFNRIPETIHNKQSMAEKRPIRRFREFFEGCRARAVTLALEEDRYNGDITTLATIDPAQKGLGVIVAKSDGVVAGIDVAKQVFHATDDTLSVRLSCHDGEPVKAGDRILEVEGRVSPMLIGERTALNFMQRMSGIATKTRMFVDKVSHTKAGILDTRKTAPGLRYFDKEAVRIGGGVNHRFGLFDMILIKDNHIDSAGGVANAIMRAKKYCIDHSLHVRIETEVRSIDELKQAIACEPDIVLLDNFTTDGLAEAVAWARNNGSDSIVLEASGNVGLHNVADIAQTGIDFISIGELTHSVKALDLSMNIILV